MTLCSCQNSDNFTTQRRNLKICKFKKVHLGWWGNPDGMQSMAEESNNIPNVVRGLH